MDKQELKDDLGLMQTAYAVTLVLGLKNAAELLCYFCETGVGSGLAIVRLVATIVLIFTTLRFFWGLGNIKRFIARNKTAMRTTRGYVVSIHFLILLVQAFALCILMKHNLDTTTDEEFLHAIQFMVYGYGPLLLLNAGWLSVLIWGQEDRNPELTWIVNNTIAGAGTLIVYWVGYLLTGSPFVGFLFCVPLWLANNLIDMLWNASAYVCVEPVREPLARAA